MVCRGFIVPFSSQSGDSDGDGVLVSFYFVSVLILDECQELEIHFASFMKRVPDRSH